MLVLIANSFTESFLSLPLKFSRVLFDLSFSCSKVFALSAQVLLKLSLLISILSTLLFNSSVLLIASSTALTFSKPSAVNNPLSLSQANAFLNSGLM